jgi:hypothetical protein
MKRNAFGEVVCEPDDDPWSLYADHLGLDMDDNLIAFRFVERDETFGWCCELEDESGVTVSVHGFTSEENLRLWARKHHIEEI